MSTLFEITCLCGASTDVVEVTSQLPISKATCSCNSCRYVTGVLYVSCPLIKVKPSNIERLRPYKTSEKFTRYFCPTCGSPMFIDEGDCWKVYAGVLEKVVDPEQHSLSIENYTEHIYTGDTVDGGLVLCLAESETMPAKYFFQGPDDTSIRPTPSKSSTGFVLINDSYQYDDAKRATLSRSDPMNSTVKSELRASCHCGGVQFDIGRPNEMSKKCSSPWPDLIVPNRTGLGENPYDVKWWMRANDTKYLAGTCACRYCRLSSGCPIQTWAFVPKANLFKVDGSPLNYDLGSLQQYNSSRDCYREFCRICGASVFWHCKARPDIVDVSVGLLRAIEGSRAETWLEWWTERVSFKEDAVDKVLIDEFEKGLLLLLLQAQARERRYPKASEDVGV